MATLATGVLLAVAGCGAGTATPSPAPTGGTAATSQPPAAANPFQGKTVTLIAPDKPGGGYDRWDRLVAPFLAKYLGAKVDVVNVPGASTMTGTEHMVQAAPDGLTVSAVDPDSLLDHQVTGSPGPTFHLSQFVWLARASANVTGVFAYPGSPYHSFQDLLKLRGGSRQVVVLDVPSGAGDLTNRVLFGAFGIPNHLLTGYSTTTGLEAGFLRGDGQIASGTYSSWRSLVAGKEAVLVLASPLATQWKGHAGALTLGAALASTKLSPAAQTALQTLGSFLSLGHAFATTPGVPAATAAVLRQAFQKAFADPQLLARATKEKLSVGFLAGPQLAQRVQQVAAHASSLAPYLK